MVKKQSCVSWHLFLSKLSIAKSRGSWKHLKMFVLVMHFFQIWPYDTQDDKGKLRFTSCEYKICYNVTQNFTNSQEWKINYADAYM
jgi:hypothetical protein